MLVAMERMPGEDEAAERLRTTCLRAFGPAPADDEDQDVESWRAVIPRDVAPVPYLLMYALRLIGLTPEGPGEKVAWWVNFAYEGESCQLAFQKFGLRLYLRSPSDKEAAAARLDAIVRKLQAAVRVVEKVVLDAAPDLLGQGDATVVNQHRTLRRAYDYFRGRARDPDFIPDEEESGESPGGGSWRSFRSGQTQMRLNAFHDMVAALSAYISLLEHDLVLSLAFTDFDPRTDNLTEIIGARWGDKWDRVFGKQEDASRLKRRLFDAVERWRNPYSHGGFEKGHGATIYLHPPGVGSAVPVGLSNVRRSPLFSFLPAVGSDIVEVFELLDEVDAWVLEQLPDAMLWIRESGLQVRFDAGFRREAAEASQAGAFEHFVDRYDYLQDQIDNMDF